MAIHDLFSKRMKRERGELPDVYQYHVLPREFRVQVIHIWRAMWGVLRRPRSFGGSPVATRAWPMIAQIIRRERGVFSLDNLEVSDRRSESELATYFLNEGVVERALDVIELVFREGFNLREDLRWEFNEPEGPTQTPEEAIEELNARFREHGVGYQFESGQIVRVDSQFLHSEVVKPALGLLQDPAYAGPNAEFLTAHEHHRHGRQKECLVDCLKAFESTMKVIGARQGWELPDKATASSLIKAMFDNNLVPAYVQSQMSALKSVLESGVPTLRNKAAGHGQGAIPTEVPDYVAAYALHATAANIVFLVEAERALR